MKTTTMSQDGSATMAALFMKSNTISNLRAIAGVLVLMIAGATQAASTGFNQTAAGPYDYNTAGNWVSSTINGIWDTSLTLTAAQTVTFATDTALGTGLTFNYAGNFALTNQASGAGTKTITLGGDISLNTSGGTTANVTIGNDTNHLNVDLGGLTRTMTVAASRTLTLMDVVSNGGIAKAGSGTLTLSGNNSYSSGTTISAGTLVANSGTAFGTGKVTVSGSSTLNFLPSLTFTNDIEVNAALSVKDIMTTVTNNTLTFTGVLSGSGAISVVNNGQSAAKGEFAFTNPNNTWTGDFIMPSGNAVGYDQFSFSSIGDGGKFTLQKAGNQNMIFYTGSSNITFNSRVLNLGAISGMMDGGGVTPVNRFANYGSGTVTFNTDLTVAGVGTSTAGTYLFFGGTNTGINTFAGIIPNSTSGNNLGIGKSDSGKWILTRDNTFLGNIKVSGGTLSVTKIDLVANAQPLGKGPIIEVGHQNTTGTLEFTGSTDSITDKKLQMGNQNSNGGNAGGAIILNNGSGSLTFNNPTFNTNVTTVTATRTLTLGGSYAGTNTILGVIQDNVAGTGKVALTKNADNSIWVLSGANTYSGATAVNGGMLVFAKKQAKSSATVTVAAAGSIGLGVSASDSAYYSSSELDSLYANTLSGFSMNAASGVGIDTTAGDFTYSSSITANRALTKLGANKLILSGTNTYSKATTIMAGTLALGATDVMPDASAIIIGTATLDAQTYSDTCGTLDVTGTAVINLTSGGNLAFADSSAVNSGTWAGTLNIIVGTLGSTSIRFGSTSSGLTAAQLGKITVNGEGAGKYYLNANGYLTTARGTVIQLF